ncbi:MAG: hypothetical protein ACLFNR_02410 [Candidatus Paceibacterota bacterium]
MMIRTFRQKKKFKQGESTMCIKEEQLYALDDPCLKKAGQKASYEEASEEEKEG